MLTDDEQRGLFQHYYHELEQKLFLVELQIAANRDRGTETLASLVQVAAEGRGALAALADAYPQYMDAPIDGDDTIFGLVRIAP